jgi:hypothetical protein
MLHYILNISTTLRNVCIYSLSCICWQMLMFTNDSQSYYQLYLMHLVQHFSIISEMLLIFLCCVIYVYCKFFMPFFHILLLLSLSFGPVDCIIYACMYVCTSGHCAKVNIQHFLSVIHYSYNLKICNSDMYWIQSSAVLSCDMPQVSEITTSMFETWLWCFLNYALFQYT